MTWYVSEAQGRTAAVCLQASSKSRLRGFIFRRPDHFVIERPYPLDHDGREITGHKRQSLLRSLQRNNTNCAALRAAEILVTQARATMILLEVRQLYRLPDGWLKTPGRHRLLRIAKVMAAHELQRQLDLGPAEIAAVMQLSNHSTATFLLGQPYPQTKEES